MSATPDARAAERAKYESVYDLPRYRMAPPRYRDTVEHLKAIPVRGSLLDVSCGRGEMLSAARALGFWPVHGTEYLHRLCRPGLIEQAEAHDLPQSDKSYEVVTMWDVIEHLIPGDDELACRHLGRIARSHVLLTANNRASVHQGVDLHINKRPHEQWDALFREWFAGATVTWLQRGACDSEFWRIDL